MPEAPQFVTLFIIFCHMLIDVMRIGITGVGIDVRNAEVLDIIKAVKASGNTYEMIYPELMELEIGTGKGIGTYQALPRPSGSGSERKGIEAEAVILRHIGIIRDYEQFSHRLSCVRAFELNGIRVMNSVESWLAASDKLATTMLLARHGLSVPKTISSEQMFSAYSAVKGFRHAVVKPLRSAMGFGVFRIDDPDVGMHIFSYLTNVSKPIYTQEFLEKRHGGDYRIIVVGGNAIGAEFRKAKTWKSNIAQGAVPKAARLNDELRELAIKSTEVLGLEYAGIDIAETKAGYFVLEANPTIAWRGFIRVTHVNPARHIVRHLLGLARR